MATLDFSAPFRQWLFRRKPAPVDIRPNRASRRRLERMKPGEMQMRFERAAIAKAQRKAARGYDRAHVRKREIYTAGVNRGVDMTLRALKNQLTGRQRKTWDQRIKSRLVAA